MLTGDKVSNSKYRVGKQGAAFAVLVLYFIFEYIKPQGQIPILIPLRIPMFLTLSLLVIFFTGKKELFRDRLAIYVLLFLFLIGFSVTYAINTYHVWDVFKGMAIMILGTVMVMPLVCNTRKRLVMFFYLWVLINLEVAVHGITHGGTVLAVS